MYTLILVLKQEHALSYNNPSQAYGCPLDCIYLRNSSGSCTWATQVPQVVKNPPANARDVRDAGLIPGSGRSPGEGNGTPEFLPGEEPGSLQSMGLPRIRYD